MAVKMDDINTYLDGAKRPLKEGMNLYLSHHVVKAGVIDEGNTVTEYFGLVLQTTSPRSAPHEVNLKICENTMEWWVKCSCKAGLGRKCKHAVALMIYVHYNDKLEKVSCTDMAQKWGVTKSAQTVGLFDAKKFSELCCVKAKKFQTASIPDDVNETNFRRLVAAAPGSAVDLHFYRKRNLTEVATIRSINEVTADVIDDEALKHILMFPTTNMPIREMPDLTPELKTFYFEQIAVGADEICEISRQKSMWKLEQRKRINSNDAYILFTYTKNKNPKWDTKVISYMNPSKAKIKGMADSRQWNDIGIKCYESLFDCKIESIGYVVSPIVPWMGCTVVGLVRSTKKIVEIKCPVNKEQESLEDMLKGLPYLNSECLLKEKTKVYAHIQLSMGILNATSCDFVVYSKFEDDCFVQNVPVDINYIKEIVFGLEPIFFHKFLPELHNSKKSKFEDW